MGWVWRDDNSDDLRRDNSSEGCSTTKVVKSQCRTEEVESGKFIRKCEKTEELLRNCIGKPVEVLQSNKEYTEEDITDEVLKGRSVPYSSSDRGMFDFPGLRNDMEVMERNLFGGLSRFLESAEEMTNDFFDAFGKSPRIFDAESSSPSVRRGIPNARRPEASKTQEKESGDTDYVSLAQDV
ncbi:hypothetical protein PHAVU_001G197500 [Phaseolus vulgaris]|uniref:Mal d 1-associated protein n=1 Tax=Phaseolus vulgaris TaxID=3885 RepID=V7D1C1_PHAVU|nr:hypothetical protein PHAVU_001G197500g [Phaseolus vulgaris]ESW34991.1 hypothetical protein PHAVU_001G197500g [Phaseolus vulgaris]